MCANWIITTLLGALNKEGLEIDQSPVSAQQLGGVLVRISDNTISGKIAKQVFEALWKGEGKDADEVIEAKGLKQVTDTGAIEALVDEVIANNPAQVEQYKGGKEQLLGFFVGQIMKASKGKANPGQVNQMLKKKLAE
jgi:aspartyl-tRNA(Asn)/glutamyl-tRNA(Gln) amidotransferase subunit B